MLSFLNVRSRAVILILLLFRDGPVHAAATGMEYEDWKTVTAEVNFIDSENWDIAGRDVEKLSGPGFGDAKPFAQEWPTFHSKSRPAGKKQKLFFALKPHVREGGSPGAALLGIRYPENFDLTFRISVESLGIVETPQSVRIPAGETRASFDFKVVDDKLTNLDRYVSVRLSNPRSDFYISNETVIYDDEPPPRLKMKNPEDAVELPNLSTVHRIKVVLKEAPTGDGYITISARPSEEVEVSRRVLFLKGNKVGYGYYDAIDDLKLDGNVKVVFTAKAAGKVLGKCFAHTIDNESDRIKLVMPSSIEEGESEAGRVIIGGILPKAVKIRLSRSPGSDLVIPRSVTIPAGQTEARFMISAPENSNREGSRTVKVIATNPGFPTASQSIRVFDDDLFVFRFSLIKRVVNQRDPIQIRILATNIDGDQVRFYGLLDLKARLHDGSVVRLSPSPVRMLTGDWSGTVSMPAGIGRVTELIAGLSNGHNDEWNSFSTLRSMNLTTSDVVWDPGRKLIYASVPKAASGSYSNQVVAIDPETLRVVGSVPTGGDPGRMVITNGGEYLYVGLGDRGSVARIDLDTLGLDLLFDLAGGGSAPIYAGDMAVVAGSPDLLVVSCRNVDRVAVFENGVARVTQEVGLSCRSIEPSSDPSVFFGSSWGNSPALFYTFSVDDAGITKTAQKNRPLNVFAETIISEGDKVYTSDGGIVDGPNMEVTGTLAFEGLFCPDSRSGRLFALHPEDARSDTGPQIVSFDTTTQARIGNLPLPGSVTGVTGMIRWGENGLVLRLNGKILFFNNPDFVPAGPMVGPVSFWGSPDLSGKIQTPGVVDSDGDGIADALEAMFGTSPERFSPNPVVLIDSARGKDGYVRIRFPRRQDFPESGYRYEISSDLAVWNSAHEVSESVVSVERSAGSGIETVEATIPCKDAQASFVRIGMPLPQP